MAYFENFPLIGYDLVGQRPFKFKAVTDIFLRTKILENVQNNIYVYYSYDVQDVDTPEILASKYYNDPNKHWIILFANNIVDPFYDWPLSDQNFVAYIKSKYTTISNAQTTYHHYEKVITKTESFTQTVTVNRYTVDYDTYLSLPAIAEYQTINLKDGNTVQIETSRNAVTNYDYENELNESKRKIKIIDKFYVPQIEKEFLNLVTFNA